MREPCPEPMCVDDWDPVHCMVCSLWVNGEEQRRSHCRGHMHTESLQRFRQRMGEPEPEDSPCFFFRAAVAEPEPGRI